MKTRIKDKNIWIVYATILLLGVAYGASLSVTPLQLNAIHFTKRAIGTLASWFALGIVGMSIPSGALIRRFSAKAVLLGSLAGYAVAVGVFPLQSAYPGAATVRFFDGACSVGVWVSCETILLSRSGPAQKAFVMSFYAMAIAIGYAAGALIARLIVLTLPYLAVFLTASAITVVALLMVAALLDKDERVAEAESSAPVTRATELTWKIKTSCLATFSYGYFQASVVLFLPLFLMEQKHVAEKQTILATAFFAGGMLVFSNFVGRIGDRVGHLRVMTALATIGMTMIIGFVVLDSWPIMCGAIFVAGGTLASLSPVSLALQGHIADTRDYSRANAIYNAFYATGMLIGPPITSAIFQQWGGPAMLYHFAALWALFIMLTILFRHDDPHTRVATVE